MRESMEECIFTTPPCAPFSFSSSAPHLVMCRILLWRSGKISSRMKCTQQTGRVFHPRPTLEGGIHGLRGLRLFHSE